MEFTIEYKRGLGYIPILVIILPFILILLFGFIVLITLTITEVLQGNIANFSGIVSIFNSYLSNQFTIILVRYYLIFIAIIFLGLILPDILQDSSRPRLLIHFGLDKIVVTQIILANNWSQSTEIKINKLQQFGIEDQELKFQADYDVAWSSKIPEKVILWREGTCKINLKKFYLRNSEDNYSNIVSIVEDYTKWVENYQERREMGKQKEKQEIDLLYTEIQETKEKKEQYLEISQKIEDKTSIAIKKQIEKFQKEIEAQLIKNQYDQALATVDRVMELLTLSQSNKQDIEEWNEIKKNVETSKKKYEKELRKYRRSEKLNQILKSYSEISLTKLADFLEIESADKLREIINSMYKDFPFIIEGNNIRIELTSTDKNYIEKQLNDFLNTVESIQIDE